MEGNKEKAILALDYDDDDSSEEEEEDELFDNSKVDWRVKGILLRGKDFSVSENGNCPRCQSNIIVFVIQDELFPMGDMPEILYNLLAKGKAVLWSSQDKQSCKKSPTFMCKGFCPPDPLGAGFNINWDTVNLTKLLRDLLKLNITKAHKKLQDQANEKAKEDEGQDEDVDEKDIIRNMLAKEKEKEVTEKPIVGPLRENESTPVTSVSSSETVASSSETVSSTLATPVTVMSSSATASYPISKDGSCPHCRSTNIRYIILIKDVNKDITLPPTLDKLLKLGKAFKMAKGANSPPSFQCCSCTYGFNLDWSATNLKKIFKLEYQESSSSTSSTTTTATTARSNAGAASTSYQKYTATSYATAAYPTSSYGSYTYSQPLVSAYNPPPLMSYSTASYGYAPPPLMSGMGPPMTGMIPPPPMTSMVPPMTSMAPPMTSMAPPMTGMAPPMTGMAPPMSGMAPPMSGMIPPAHMAPPPYGAPPMPFPGAPPQPYLGMPPQPYGPIPPQFTPTGSLMGPPQLFPGAPPNQFGPTPMLGGMPPGPSMYGLQPGDMVAPSFPAGNFPPGNIPPGTFPPGNMQGSGNFPGNTQGGLPRLRVPSAKLRKQEKKWKHGKWSKGQKGRGGNYGNFGGHEQSSNDAVESQDNEGEEDTSEDLYDPEAATRFEELLNKIDGENDGDEHEDEKPPGEESQAEFEVAAFTPDVKPALDTVQNLVTDKPALNVEKVAPKSEINEEKTEPKTEAMKESKATVTEPAKKLETSNVKPEPMQEDISPVDTSTTTATPDPAKVSGSDANQADMTSEAESQKSEGVEPSPTTAPRTKAARGRKRQASGGRKKAVNPRNTRTKKAVEDIVGSEDGTGTNNGTDGSIEELKGVLVKEGTGVSRGTEESMQEPEDIEPKRVTRARSQRRKK